jgi:hypothetical protein
MFMIVRRITFLITTVALVGLGAAGTASASATLPAGVDEAMTAMISAPCEWVVVWPDAGVYEKPTRMNPPLKVKHSGDRVGGGYCMKHYNESEREWYVSVTCTCAADDIGWMRRNALRAA